MRYLKKHSRAAFVKALAAILVVTLLTCQAFADAAEWDLRLPDGISKIEKEAFAGDKIRSIYVGDNVTSIGASAFADSTLCDIRLPEGLSTFSPDAFRNVPHVEIYGSPDPELFAGMDNVSFSGENIDPSSEVHVNIAPKQTVCRTFTPPMSGSWYFEVSGCSVCEMHDLSGELLGTFTEDDGYLYLYYDFETTDAVQLYLYNDTDALINAEIICEPPFTTEYSSGKAIGEYKDRSGGTLLELYDQYQLSLDSLAPNEYYCPVLIIEASDGMTAKYDVDLFVDDVKIGNWNDWIGDDVDESIAYLFPSPEEAMLYNGFETGDHTARFVVNKNSIEFDFNLTESYDHQMLDRDTNSVFIRPGTISTAKFIPTESGTYTFRSDNPFQTPLCYMLLREDEVIASSSSDDPSARNFEFSVTLDGSQTVILKLWYPAPEDGSKPCYGVVPITVNDPYDAGDDLSENAICRAIVIGQTYETTPPEMWISELPGCAIDATEMTSFLSSLDGTAYSVQKYTNLSASDILDAISDDLSGATDDDVSLFYYSGHGETGSGSLIGADGQTISPQALKAALDKIPGKKIILLDSCFSGNLIGRDPDSADNAAIARAAQQKFISAFSLHGREIEGYNNYYILTGSSMYETSIGYLNSMSLFTESFLDAFSSNVADKNADGRYTLAELYNFCLSEVRETLIGQTVCAYPDNSDQVLFIP